MDEKEDRIRRAAQELSEALTDHGGEFYVTAYDFDLTQIQDFSRRHGYTVTVKLCAERVLAP